MSLAVEAVLVKISKKLSIQVSTSLKLLLLRIVGLLLGEGTSYPEIMLTLVLLTLIAVRGTHHLRLLGHP